MNKDEMIAKATEIEPRLKEGGIVLAFDAGTLGCVSDAYAVDADGKTEPLAIGWTDVGDDEEDERVDISRDGEDIVTLWLANNGIREMKLTDECVLVYVNSGKTGIVLEGTLLEPGKGGSEVPV